MSELIDRQVALDTIKFAELGREYDEVEKVQIFNPWHRVEDGLPEIGKIVLVYDEWHGLSICQLDKQYRWLRQGGGWFDAPYARYWMPIEPPKEDADADK